MFEIKKAEKHKQKLRLLLVGGSGSGKTYSALELMSVLSDKFAVIDSENESSALYADKFNFDILNLDGNYNPEVYIEAIKAVEKAGYTGLIIDSATPEWAGPNGCLAMVDRASRKSTSGNSFTAWNGVTEKHNKFIDAILNSSCHVIVTCRAKTKYEIKKNEKGKNVPIKLGLEPVQRDGFEYEFTTVFNLDDEHCFTCSKDRSGLFKNTEDTIPLNKEIAEQLLEWLGNGQEKSIKEEPKETERLCSDAQFQSTIKCLKNKTDIKDIVTVCKKFKEDYSLSANQVQILNDLYIEMNKKLATGDK